MWCDAVLLCGMVRVVSGVAVVGVVGLSLECGGDKVVSMKRKVSKSEGKG